MSLRWRTLPRLAAFGLLAFALAGCFSLAPQPDPSRFFTLLPEGLEAPTSPALTVRVVAMPPYLQSRHFALRGPAHEVVYEPFWIWAGPLDQMLEVTLEQALRTRGVTLPEATRLEVRVQRFEGHLAGGVSLVADWQLRSLDPSPALAGARFSATLPWPRRDDVDALVGSLAALADALAAEIAEGL